MQAQNAAAARQRAAMERAAFLIGVGPISFEQFFDPYRRIIFAFQTNSADVDGKPVFAADTLATGAGRLFIPDVDPPAAGTSRALFVSPANSGESFAAGG
jgi:hypothetical protein